MKNDSSGNGEKYDRIISNSWAVNCIAAEVIYVFNASCLNTYNYSTGISQNSSTIIFPKQSDYFIEFLDYSRVIKPSLNFIATVSFFCLILICRYTDVTSLCLDSKVCLGFLSVIFGFVFKFPLFSTMLISKY